MEANEAGGRELDKLRKVARLARRQRRALREYRYAKPSAAFTVEQTQELWERYKTIGQELDFALRELGGDDDD